MCEVFKKKLPNILFIFIFLYIFVAVFLFKLMNELKIKTFKPLIRAKCTIPSPSDDMTKPAFLDVPHLQNHFNRKKAINDWFVRNLYEYKTATSSFFLTLTYDDFSLPRMPDGRPGFCPEDVACFWKNVRNRLQRVFGSSIEFRFFLSSEYGTQFHRPHYHAVIFFPGMMVLHAFFRKIVKDSWPHGFCDLAHPRSNAVLTYVSKYVAKDLYANPELRSSLDDEITWQNPDREVRLTFDEMQQRNFSLFLKPTKKRLSTVTLHNFHRQSKGFGKSLIDSLTEADWERGYICLGDGVNVFRYAIPKYVVDKVCRKTVFWKTEDGVIHSETSTTEFGKKVFEWRVQHNADYLLNRALELMLPQNQAEIEKLGLMYDIGDIDIRIAYKSNKVHTAGSISADFYNYLRYKRNYINYAALPDRYYDPVKDTFISRDEFFFVSDDGVIGRLRHHYPHNGKRIDYKFYLHNVDYPGYELFLDSLNEIETFIKFKQQRAEEMQEYKKLMDKIRKNLKF